MNISIHALLAESDINERCKLRRDNGISIHALLAESDFRFSVFDFLDLSFLSTLSLRRATFNGDHGHMSEDISIHALLAESD